MILTALRNTTRVQIVSLILLALTVFGYASGTTGLSLIVLAGILCLWVFRTPLLWRIRNRLLLTFFLSGVVPLLLIGAMLLFAAELLLGQLASARVARDLESRIALLSGAAQDIALATSRVSDPPLLDALRQRVPRMAAVIRTNSGTMRMPSNGAIPAPPPELIAEFEGLIQFQSKFYLAARKRGTAFQTDVLVYLPLDEEELASLTSGVVEVSEPTIQNADVDVDVEFERDNKAVSITKDGNRTFLQPKRLPGPTGWWDWLAPSILNWPILNPAGGDREVVFVAVSRPSLLLAGITKNQMTTISIIVLAIVGGFFLFVEFGALLFSLLLTRAITRSVHDLYKGTLQMGQGNFAYQIPVRGKHQLSELATSFNSMSSQIQHFLGEMKKKEKIESELEIARQVQARLFPRTVPELRTLAMQGVCIPGRFISGDYYDFVKLNDRYTAIALGDVSGKGVSAALLMASIQASLHAQLGFGRGLENPVLSTATLMALIGQQLYENTPAEKYATFFCSVYDDQTGILRYTNAGHLKPILVRDGKTSVLEGDGMVVGLMPNVTYEQQEIQLAPGDVVAIFSDGIPEAEDASAQEYGEARLAELLRTHSTKPLDELIKSVTDSVDSWAHDPTTRDDTTIVVMRRTA